MALFTIQQADACTITRAESVKLDGVHAHWLFGVIDEDGDYCVWSDVSLSPTASNSEQREAIRNHLTTYCEKTPSPPEITYIDNNDIIDTSVGATGP